MGHGGAQADVRKKKRTKALSDIPKHLYEIITERYFGKGRWCNIDSTSATATTKNDAMIDVDREAELV